MRLPDCLPWRYVKVLSPPQEAEPALAPREESSYGHKLLKVALNIASSPSEGFARTLASCFGIDLREHHYSSTRLHAALSHQLELRLRDEAFLVGV